MNFIKEYKFDLEDFEIETIQEQVKNKIESLKEKGKRFYENLNNTNNSTGDHYAIFGFMSEYLVEHIDENVDIIDNEMGEKYDYKREKKGDIFYIDIKGFKTTKTLDDFISKKYKIYLQAKQIEATKKWADENKIPYDKIQYEIVWWNGILNQYDNYLVRLSSLELRLDNIIKLEPKYENPWNTKGSSTKILNYIINPFKNLKEKNKLKKIQETYIF